MHAPEILFIIVAPERSYQLGARFYIVCCVIQAFGDDLKKWEQRLVFGIFAIAIGIIVIAWDCQAINPIEIKQIGDQFSRATLNTTFIGLLLTGFFLIGGGIGEASCSYAIYKLEKQIAKQHLPFSSSETRAREL